MILNIGRGDTNEVIISESEVSKLHAQLVLDDNEDIFINDLQSKNGTYVNGVIISEPTQLKSGDIVKLAGIPFPWETHLPKSKIAEPTVKQEEPAPKKKSRLVYFSMFLGIAALILAGVYLGSEYFSEQGNNTTNSGKKDGGENGLTTENKDIVYDLSCLGDEEDLGSTDFISILSDINDALVDATTVEVSLEDEIEFAEYYHEEIEDETRFKYDTRHDKLKSILRGLVSKIPDPVGYDYNIYLIDDETINAFTTGAGYIYFYTGMLDFAENDDEIAAIIGHEIYHNELGHIKHYLEIQKTNNSLFGDFGNLFTNIHRGLTITFNQRKETNSDLHGLDLCGNAGFQLCSTVEVWKRMSEDEGGYNPVENLLRTHPYSEKRESCARNHIQSNYNKDCQ